MKNRVVITGLGVLAPNAHGLENYENALRRGISGIRFIPLLQELNFNCQVAGIPQGVEEIQGRYFSPDRLKNMNRWMVYTAIAAMDCWTDAGFKIP